MRRVIHDVRLKNPVLNCINRGRNRQRVALLHTHTFDGSVLTDENMKCNCPMQIVFTERSRSLDRRPFTNAFFELLRV